MTILFNSASPVKTPRPFGAGILPGRPRRFEPTVEERSQWAAECDRLGRERASAALNRRLDQAYGESEAARFHEMGLRCY
jgi:hypothetical protein